MHIKLSGLLLAAVFTHSCSNAPSTDDSERPKANSNYVGDANSTIVTTGQGECLRTSTWTEVKALVECGASVKAPAKPAAPVAKKAKNILVSFSGRALFEFDSSELTSAGRNELSDLVKKLNGQSKIKNIEIVGHADSTGPDEYNMKLSERRANTVKGYLQKSLQAVAVTARGMGETAPIADNSTANGRRLNRRVEVEVGAEKTVIQ